MRVKIKYCLFLTSCNATYKTIIIRKNVNTELFNKLNENCKLILSDQSVKWLILNLSSCPYKDCEFIQL
jgi:hypothetical protein